MSMIGHVHQALAQVRTIHRHMLEKQRFKGYSGRARALSGCIALLASIFLAQQSARTHHAALFTWVAVAVISMAINYSAVLSWHFSGSADERPVSRLKPLLDVLPAVAVGALLTLLEVRDGHVAHLPAMWMLAYGAANCSSSHRVPTAIAWVGAYYLAAGTALIFLPQYADLGNPWPMGIIFFLGEWIAGWILHLDGAEHRSWRGFFGLA